MGKKKTLFYIFFITVIISALTFYFFSLPIINRINNTKSGLQSKHSELIQLQKKESKLMDLDKNYKNYQEKIDIITKMFPKVKDVSDYIVQLEQISLLSNVGIDSIKIAGQVQNTKDIPQPQYTQLTKNGDIYELPIDLIIRSENYENIVNYSQTIEKLSRFTSIKKVSIKILECKKLEATISLIIYVLP